MNDRPGVTCTHEVAQQLLPWAVNGRLTAAESSSFDAHLADCESCRRDYAHEREIRGAMRARPRVEYAPQPSLQKLWSRIDAAGTAPGIGPSPMQGAQHTRARTTHSGGYSWERVAAAAVLGLLVGGLLAASLRTGPAAPIAAYRTASQSDADDAAPVQIRVVFAPNTSVDELTQLLREAGLTVATGPSASGVFGLSRVTGEQRPASEALARLRADPRVRFAEPVVPADGGGP
ncbi:MAG: zf-HC2 domain-containing protein [Steroidobacteraceae bacterium]|nr:zf-HC2 domain-containing protein [Steroidobacteraceae bacterium]